MEIELSGSFGYSTNSYTIVDFQFVNNKVKFTGTAGSLAGGMNFVNFANVKITNANISNNIFLVNRMILVPEVNSLLSKKQQ